MALKIPNDPQYVRNLQKDGAAIHGLRHPGIVEAVDFDPYSDPPYLAMEYVPGSSLRPLIQERKLGVPEAVAVLRQVLAALAHAHAMGVVHRDIKPENILVHERAFRDGFSSEGVVKVTDFGLGHVHLSGDSIAISTSVSLQDARHMVGTLAYMPPEVREGLAADARADLYACGVVFFEMLTGRKPHGADFPSKTNASVPAHLDEAFRMAYAWLDDRYATAEAFSEGLNEPDGPPPSLPPQPEDDAAPPVPEDGRSCENSIGMELVRIEPGTFTMGSPPGEDGRLTDETQHRVTLSKPYYIGKHHVTRGQFARFVAETSYGTDAEKKGDGRVFDAGKNAFQNVNGVSWREPGFDQADDHPVVLVSCNDAVSFTEWLGKTEGRKYRLPTEAQWEFACRNDNDDTQPFNTGYTITTSQANYDGIYTYGKGVKRVVGRKGTTPVGTFPPNARGLCDMHGNAWQWCSDIYGDYPSRAVVNPAGPQPVEKKRQSRVLRGGSWDSSPQACRSARRGGNVPVDRASNIGFRVALETA